MSFTFRSPERLTNVAPLGVCFWDTVTGRMVADALRVTAYREVTPAAAGDKGVPPRRVAARANLSGIFVFHHLPGLRKEESGAGDDAYWADVPSGHRFVLEVIDDKQRFLPCRFTAEAPARDLFNLTCMPPVSLLAPRVPGIPLFSTPVRRVPAAMAVMRAELWDAAAGRQAAWAMGRLRIGGASVALGMADDRGCLALIFPYPEPRQLGLLSSPAGPGRLPLAQQVWPIDFAVYYAPGVDSVDIPELCEVYAQLITTPQSTWAAVSPPTLFSQANLEFGKELVLATAGFHALLVTPAGTAPVALPPL